MLQATTEPMLTTGSRTNSHRFEGKTFEDQTIAIDGNQYINCTFIKCRIIFTGFEEGVFDECKFISCDWGFSGPAVNTLNYLAAIYNGLGENGHEMVEGIFESIRRGIVKTGELLASPNEPA